MRIALLLLALLAGARPVGPAESSATAALDLAVAQAQASLQKGDIAAAQLHYGRALFEGWLALATIERLAGRLAEARAAVENAATSAAGDASTTRVLASAWRRVGEPERAVKVLDARPAGVAEDPEAAFLLGTEYLWLKQGASAERLFAQALAARPLPQLHVLIGRAYRDAGEYERARRHLRSALTQDPRVRHAHYYLGMTALADAASGPDRLDVAISEFRAELSLSPMDPLSNDQLGVALLDAGRAAEALPALEIAAKGETRFLSVSHLGRGQLALDRPAEAAASLRRALVLAGQQGAGAAELRTIHYQLALALRKLGDAPGAAEHFAAARQASAEDGAEGTLPASVSGESGDGAMGDTASLADLPAPRRDEVARHVKGELARTYLNLGVIEAQAQRFPEAAQRFEQAASVDPAFPQVQSSLGIAYFNAREFGRAVAPLERALAASPGETGLARMLAMAWLNTEDYAKAADMLRDDPDRDADPSLQFAYGMALVKSERAAEAEQVFARLLRAHGDSAELSVMLGQAHAQQGNFEAALESLQRALSLKPDVAEARSTMGVIYLKQGRLAEAEQALRAETAAHPSDLRAQQDLAVVLDLLQRADEALPLLRRVVESRPQQTGAQYLLGKILLAQGASAEAVLHLEAAVKASPDDASAHYQLGRAYEKLGQPARAEHEFERFRE
ncbi:MAG TPA: tetratricopeptide repeat protein, partial [Vicinamibacteria bacterium]|nr:tetratricopeptide repeat protein [Vicinamibacteria bacterium]